MTVVLASASPRRERLLGRIVRKFSVRIAKIDERIRAGEPFSRAAVRLAKEKTIVVSSKNPASVVVGADTIAYFGRRNFRKTENEKTARRVLSSLRGRTHFVITGVAVLFPNGKCVKYFVKAAVKMRRFSGKELERYLKSGEWKGRAGCYDVSGKGAKLVKSVKGEKETVIGLPLLRLRKLLLRR